jgi:hypothetical protein
MLKLLRLRNRIGLASVDARQHCAVIAEHLFTRINTAGVVPYEAAVRSSGAVALY